MDKSHIQVPFFILLKIPKHQDREIQTNWVFLNFFPRQIALLGLQIQRRYNLHRYKLQTNDWNMKGKE